jgi:hypothetical protein
MRRALPAGLSPDGPQGMPQPAEGVEGRSGGMYL